MAFSGGSYEDVARWLWNFLTSHSKREQVRIEVELEAGGERQGRWYGARLRLGERRSALLEFDYKDVAEHRGSFAWCQALAARVRAEARELTRAGGPGWTATG